MTSPHPDWMPDRVWLPDVDATHTIGAFLNRLVVLRLLSPATGGVAASLLWTKYYKGILEQNP